MLFRSMRRTLTLALLCIGVLTGSLSARAELLDRIVAVIDSSFIVTLSDVRRERAIQIALGAKPGTDDAIIDALVERHLVEDQIAQFREIEIDAKAVEDRLREAKSQDGVIENELRRAIADELRRYEFMVQRFGQFIRVSDDEARKYFNDVLVPELRRNGAPIPPEAQGLELVRPNVAAEKMNQEAGAWIAELRGRVTIEKIPQ